MQAPQIIYLILSAIGFGIAITQHGKQREGKHNIWYNLAATATIYSLLYWGGFFG